MAIVALPRVQTPERPRKLGKRQERTGVLFVAPSVLFVALFFILPLIMTTYLSFTDWNLLRAADPRFIGWDNYRLLLKDTQFWQSLRFTSIYTLIITPIIMAVAFGLALLVRQRRPGVGFFRTAYFLPVVIGLNTASLIWVWLYNDDVGVINTVLRALHIIHGPQIWLANTPTALLAITIMIVWKTSGFSMILLLAGLQAIPEELYEAARVDGANAMQQMTYITLPLLRRTFALTLVLSVIGSFLSFDQFFIMTQGGPQGQTVTTVYRIYEVAFTNFRLGYGAALSLVLLGILVLVSTLQLYLLRTQD